MILAYIYAAINILIFLAICYLLVQPRQPKVWRIALGIIAGGVLWNLAGLIWARYSSVWPGEPVMGFGILLVFGVLLVLRVPLVTGPTRQLK